MAVLCERERCVGCGACFNICPRGCIKMEEDAEGFRYPQVDASSCIECGLCQKACPILAFDATCDDYGTYAVHNTNENIVMESSSGGVFTALAEEIIKKGGVVYGAGFCEDWSVTHLRINNIEGLRALRGSKYVQSDMKTAYQKAQQDLKSDIPVLFSGTPCQIAGLRQYLGKGYDNLLCVDIICHSVPSPKVWHSYLASIGEVKSVNFRDKRESWQGYYLSVKLNDGNEVLVRGKENRYMNAFIKGLSSRPSCSSCKFKGANRASDITLGDFWGVESACPEAFNNSGTSLVLIQTQKGRQAFDAVSENMVATKTARESALQGNPAYYVAAKPHKNRNIFWEKLGDTPFNSLVDELLAPDAEELRRQKMNNSIVMRLLRKIKRLIKK